MVIVRGAIAKAMTGGGRTPLDDAMASNHTAIVNFLNERLVAATSADNSKYNRELCYAAASGDLDLVKRGVENGVDPNTSLYDGRRPIHLAARQGHLKVVEYLLEQGALINQEDDRGRTPYQDAIAGGHQLMAQLLRFKRAEVGKKLQTSVSEAAMYVCGYASEGDITRLGLMIEAGL
eukprot:scaffold140286_cov50-Prasinocladus_malaysianus.AAC.2